MAGEPLAPSGLSATAVSSSQIDTAWVDNAEDAVGVNEVQTVTLDATPEVGTFTLTYDAETTAAIAYDADAAAITSALEATAAFETGDVSVDRTGNVITITYQGGLAAMSLPEITADSSLKQDASTISVSVTQSGITDTLANASISTTTPAVAEVGSTPSINTTTTAVAEAACVPSSNTTTAADSGTSTAQVDTITFDSTAVAGSMTIDGQSLAYSTDASSLSLSGATGSGTPASGTIVITWGDYDPHTPFSVATSTLLSVVGVQQVDTVTFDATPVAGTMWLNDDALAYDADASTISISGAVGSGAPSGGSITITWNDYSSHTPVNISGSLLSVAGVHQCDTISFAAEPIAGTMTIDGQSLAYNANANSLTLTGATANGIPTGTAPSGGFVYIYWDDYDSHTPFTIDDGDLFSAVGRPHIFTITLSDEPTEGRFRLTKDGGSNYTPWISFDSSAATTEAEIQNIAGGYECSVTGDAGGPWTVTSDEHIAAPTWTSDEVEPLRKAVGITIGTATNGSPQEWDDLGTEVHRSTDGFSYSLLVDLGANMESWPDATCSPSTEYYYKARAYNGSGNSAFSNTDSDTTDAAANGITSGLIAALLPAASAGLASPFDWSI